VSSLIGLCYVTRATDEALCDRASAVCRAAGGGPCTTRTTRP